MINKTSLQPVVVVEHYCLLGEGPVWDAKKQVVCWVDILNGAIHGYAPKNKVHTTILLNQLIGAFAFCNDGNFIAALQNGFAFIDKASGEINMIEDPEAHLPGNRFNDGKCDPAGRFWAGTMALTEEAGAGSVYTIEKNVGVTKKINNVSISNGMVWSADHTTLYYIDSPSFKVVAYDYDTTTGHISNERTIITISAADGVPDGMTIDTEGMLWIAHWDGWQVTRWNPATGEKLFHFTLPVGRVTSCTFGGQSLEDLYITSARVGLTDEALKSQPLAGALFVIPNCGFKGLPAFEFVQ